MRRISALAALLLFVVGVPSDAIAQHDGGDYGKFFVPVFMITIMITAAVVVVLVVRWSSQGTMPPRHTLPGREPMDILKERFARGEIDKEEFDERRRVLEN